MKKRIGYRTGILYDCWEGQIEKCFLGIKYWSTYCYFDSKDEAKKWVKNENEPYNYSS